MRSVTEEHAASLAEVSRVSTELRSTQSQLEDQRNAAGEAVTQLRSSENTAKKQKEQLEALSMQLKQLEDMSEARSREFEAAKQHSQQLIKAMSAYEQRALEVQEKDVELFNMREENKETLCEAQMERDAIAAREQELQRRNLGIANTQ